MVLQRRLDYGFNGYQAPVIPRASRSARGRIPIRKKHEETQKHALEILARVAGKFLQEGESNASSNAACAENQHKIVNNVVGQEQEDGVKSLEADYSEQATCKEKTFSCVHRVQGRHQSCKNDFLCAQDNFSFRSTSTLKNFDQSEKIYFADKLAASGDKIASRSPSVGVDGNSFHFWESNKVQVEGVKGRKLGDEPSFICGIEKGTLLVSGNLDTMELDRKPPSLVSSVSNLKASLSRDWLALGPSSNHCANMQVVSRDDDENSVGCTQTGTSLKAYRPHPDIVDQRIRNLSASRRWRVAPNSKNRAYFRDGKRKPFYHNGRTFHTRQRSQRIVPFKRRKFFNRSPLSKSGGFHRDDIFMSPDKRSNGDNCGTVGASSSIAGHQAPLESRDCNVKFNIKSFKVPELFIEIPLTATVGLLKRTVMEAVTAILGDGLRVGILRQGKKIRDDSKTLLQTGISKDDKHCSLGFMLEPGCPQIMPPFCSDDPPLLSGGMPQRLTGHTTPLTLQQGASSVSPMPPVKNLGSCVERKLDIVPSLAGVSIETTVPDSQSLVAVPEISMEALAVVPLRRKPGRPEFGQRRIRRPFSVSEVEVLVQAVEKLGTGRWRDVKLCAFDNAKHRTYVDLKDKWKTLVHTARISPQQRRGEPVPQELLDRVLAAHAYWSQQ